MLPHARRPRASLGEKALATTFILVKPAKVGGVIYDLSKARKVKTGGKSAGNLEYDDRVLKVDPSVKRWRSQIIFINNRLFRFSILVQLHHVLFKLGRECAAFSLCHSRSSSSVLGQVYVPLIFLSR
ncbi:hypothetical protein CHH74_10345 [Shouchella clausii]|nr:hypothetical protein CHH74_10345 [Shouchella clausii]